MLRLLFRALVVLAGLHAGSLFAQDGGNLGPLLQSGQSAQQSPVLERYSLRLPIRDALSNARTVRSLDSPSSSPSRNFVCAEPRRSSFIARSRAPYPFW